MKLRWSNIIAILVISFQYLPLLILIAFSFEKSKFATHFTSFTLHWYQDLFSNEDLIDAFKNSFLVGFLSVFFASIMGTLAALGLTRYHFAGKNAYRALITMPVIMPEIAMAVSALSLFIALKINLCLATIIVSHIVFCISYTTLIVMARLEGLDPKLEEAAQDLGATPLQTFLRVTLPLIAPGIITGALLSFVLSLDDFIITQFTSGVGDTTLPLWIYSSVKFGVSPEINALSTLMILLTVSVFILSELIRKKYSNTT